ncbi:MAG: hypothetical protein ACT6RE_04645 [Flavobacteriales bacterium]
MNKTSYAYTQNNALYSALNLKGRRCTPRIVFAGCRQIETDGERIFPSLEISIENCTMYSQMYQSFGIIIRTEYGFLYYKGNADPPSLFLRDYRSCHLTSLPANKEGQHHEIFNTQIREPSFEYIPFTELPIYENLKYIFI